MALTVISMATYLTRKDGGWRDEDYNASKFIKLIKGKAINKWGSMPSRAGPQVRFDGTSRAAVIACFAQSMCDHLVANNHCNGQMALVPVPSSDAVHGATFTRYPARELAVALKAELVRKGISVKGTDVLRWKTPKLPSHAGGSRDGEFLYDNLTVVGPVQAGVRYVLVDDVYTGGGHLQASKRRLVEAGANVDLAVCAGKSSQTKPPSAFDFTTAQLADLVLVADLFG